MAMLSPYREAIHGAATTYGLDPRLVEAIVLQESSGQADAFRHEPNVWARYCRSKAEYAGMDPRRVASSYGLMQVLYTTARMVGFRGEPEELFVIKTNLDVGCRYLRSLLAKLGGDVRQALAAYNGGLGGLNATAAQRYADQVLARYHALEASR